MILSNDISPEKKKLEVLKKELDKLAVYDKFYMFETHVKCKVLIDNKEMNGYLIAMDDGAIAVAKTDIGNFMITLDNQNDNQIEISNHNNSVKSSDKNEKSTSNKSIFTPLTPSNKSESVSTHTPNVKSSNKSESVSTHTPNVKSSDKSTESSSDKSTESSSDKSTESSSDRNNVSSAKLSRSIASSSHHVSSKLESPPTESSLSSSSSAVKSSSPYLATSEYDLPPRSNTQIASNINKENSKYISKTESSVVDVSSNNSEHPNKHGGFKNIKKNTQHDAGNGLKFMKAGKADNVGILESVKGYYSESTSIEYGLCE